MKKLLLTLVAAGSVFAAAESAQADSFSLHIGGFAPAPYYPVAATPYWGGYYQPVVYAPRPYYYAPPYYVRARYVDYDHRRHYDHRDWRRRYD